MVDNRPQIWVNKKKEKNAPARNGRQQTPDLVNKNNPIIISNNTIHLSYQFILFNTYPINIRSNTYTHIGKSWDFDIFKKIKFSI